MFRSKGFWPPARRERRAYPPAVCKERATTREAKSTAARRVAPKMAWGFVAPQSQIAADMLLRRASPQAILGATKHQLYAGHHTSGPHVKRLKSTAPNVPIGTTESSPRFQPWVESGEWPEPRRGDRNDGAGPVSSFVPDGTRFIFAPQPSDKSPGYFRASLRDVESKMFLQMVEVEDKRCSQDEVRHTMNP